MALLITRISASLFRWARSWVRGMSKSLTAADHHAQDALERLAAVQLQQLAEEAGRAHGRSSAEQLAELDASLAAKGHTWETLLASPRAVAYKQNLDAATSDFFERLCATHPQSTFCFKFFGTAGRIAQVKGDITIEIATGGTIEVRSVSLKNYENGPASIQVGSGTFQSFALGFFLQADGIGWWKNASGERRRTNPANKFRPWRDEALRSSIEDTDVAKAVVKLFAALDKLHDDQRALFLDTDEFLFYKESEVKSERNRVGAEGARLLHELLKLVPAERVRSRVLKATGLLDGEDLLVFGDGQIADTITDPRFESFVADLRASQLSISSSAQSVTFTFSAESPADAEPRVVLTVNLPCTINTNGAWYRDGDPYEGVRWHAKEKRNLAWGERRPKKSREISTSTNTYLDLSATGLLREMTPAADQKGPAPTEVSCKEPRGQDAVLKEAVA